MSNVKVNTINDANGGSNTVLYGVAAPANSMGFRNRIINGDMRIDQRNAGALVTASNVYNADRWVMYQSTAGTLTAQQVSDAPSGFSNSLKITTAVAKTTAAADFFNFRQIVEGFNIADFAWGTASAQTVTLSFWVKSSLTGTFGGFLQGGATYSDIFQYTINSANTWEQKSVSITGSTAGTWGKTNGSGLIVAFSMGDGSNYSTGSANTWVSGDFRNLNTNVRVSANSSATWQVTGVQLEAGSVASPFERRDYGRELMMCQRYYTHIAANANIGTACQVSTTVVNGYIPLPVTMRGGTPTVLFGSTFATTDTYSYNTAATITSITPTQTGVSVVASTSAVGAQGRATLYLLNGGAIGFQSEL